MKRACTKRGQISLFILLGVVLLMTVFILYYIQTIVSPLNTITTGSNDDGLNIISPKEYIDECVKLEVLNLLKSGEDAFTQSQTTLHENQSYVFLYTQTGGHTPFTFEDISMYLDEQLVETITTCFDETVFTNQGFDLRREQPKTITKVTPSTIKVQFDFPLTITGGSSTFDLSEHSVIISIPYGKMVLGIHEMMSAELESGWFDQQSFMHQSANVLYEEPLITVHKFKPYPHTLYKFVFTYFGEEYPLFVGIKGESTALTRSNGISYSFSPIIENTCCTIANLCYDGTTKAACEIKNGFFQESCGCEEELLLDEPVEFESCSGIESGTSWCEYHPGVGGRFYRNLCVNGEVEIESCRDYREEVCVEQNDVALCRPNTAQSCFECTDESCCSESDCAYIGEGICVPESPLGFQFWDATQDYCQALYTKVSSQADISSFTGRERNFLCSLLSDCGNSFNYYGDFSVETIDGDKLKDMLTDTGLLSYESSENPISQFELPSSNLTPSKQFAQTVSYLEEFVSVTQNEFLNPSNSHSFSQTVSQLCQPFYPSQNTCEICGEGRPCSEYSCKSLGSHCQYILVEGTHECVSELPTSENFSIYTMTQNGGTLANTHIERYSGFTLPETHSVLEPLRVTIETTKPALCKPSYVPGISFGQLSSSDLSKGVYTTNHTFVIRFLNDLPVFGSLSNYFGAESYIDLVSEIIDFSFQVEKLQRKYPFIDRFQLPFTNTLSQFVRVATDLELDSLLSYLFEFAEQKTYFLFFSCVDEAGAELSDQSFVKFALEHSCDVPLELELTPDSKPFVYSTVQLRTQTFSDCRYDIAPAEFENLSYEFSCPDSIYDVSEEGYICNADLSSLLANKSQITLFTQCVERMKDSFEFDINLDVQPELLIPVNASVNVTPDIANEYSFGIETVENQSFVVKQPIVEDLYFNFEVPTSCSLTQDISIECSDATCYIPTENFQNGTVGLTQLSCKTAPESLSCADNYNPARQSQLVEVTLQKVTPFVMDDLLISTESISFTVFSGVVRDVTCQYSIGDNLAVSFTDATQLDTNWKFVAEVSDEQTGLVAISCLDNFGITREKSGLIS